MGFRASAALSNIQNQLGNSSAVGRASTNLGIGDQEPTYFAELKIENERLKTTLMILNQKMKMQEDNDDLIEKWKAQISSKDAQISIMNEQVVSLQTENEKQRAKMKVQSKEYADLES